MGETELGAFDVWAAAVPEVVRRDPLWRLAAFRLASYALHVAWTDALALSRNPIAALTSAQLYRAVGSIAANVAEGYSRSSGRDRVRLYEYALGSARESIVWYHAASPVLGRATVVTRQELLQRVVRLLLTIIPAERHITTHRHL